jgi:hypothetical protein
VTLSLGLSREKIEKIWVQIIIAALGIAAVFMQSNGVPFLIAGISGIVLRSPGALASKSAKALLLLLICFGIIGGTLSFAKNSSNKTANKEMVKWMSHPESKLLDLGNPVKQTLRGTVGCIMAFGGYSNLAKSGKSILFHQTGEFKLSYWDWLSFLAGTFIIIMGIIAFLRCFRDQSNRVDALVAGIIVCLNAGFNFLWLGTDLFLWLGPVTFVWYIIALAFRDVHSKKMYVAANAVIIIFLACIAFRTIESPCILTNKASDAVKRTIAYEKIVQPNDAIIGFYLDFPPIASYLYGANGMYLYYHTFSNWRTILMPLLQNTIAKNGTIYINKDIMEPKEINVVETWQRVESAHLILRDELIDSLKTKGRLERIDGLLPGGPIWKIRYN